tara:strand:+ start:1986 stop:2792 length:807 start_codon:yes stop_codon:yes gene_type:complete
MRLFTSTATMAPAICDKIYGIKSFLFNLPIYASAIDTAGLKCPPEMFPPKIITIANAEPIAKGLPTASIIKTKNKVPKNSTMNRFIIINNYILFIIMSKPIEIKGKRNIDKLFNTDTPSIRTSSIASKVDKIWLEHYVQANIINKLYLNINFEDNNLIISDLKKKISGYKSQDQKKNIFNKQDFIDYESLVQMMVESKMKCFYCKCDMYLIYEKVRQMNQWTLDRIDNNIGHNKNNLVIACLECNLKRRNIDKDKFLFTKRLNIKKEE